MVVVVICNHVDVNSDVVHLFHRNLLSAVLFVIVFAILLTSIGLENWIVAMIVINDNVVDGMAEIYNAW